MNKSEVFKFVGLSAAVLAAGLGLAKAAEPQPVFESPLFVVKAEYDPFNDGACATADKPVAKAYKAFIDKLPAGHVLQIEVPGSPDNMVEGSITITSETYVESQIDGSVQQVRSQIVSLVAENGSEHRPFIDSTRIVTSTEFDSTNPFTHEVTAVEQIAIHDNSTQTVTFENGSVSQYMGEPPLSVDEEANISYEVTACRHKAYQSHLPLVHNGEPAK